MSLSIIVKTITISHYQSSSKPLPSSHYRSSSKPLPYVTINHRQNHHHKSLSIIVKTTTICHYHQRQNHHHMSLSIIVKTTTICHYHQRQNHHHMSPRGMWLRSIGSSNICPRIKNVNLVDRDNKNERTVKP